jgi:hypothetical protein
MWYLVKHVFKWEFEYEKNRKRENPTSILPPFPACSTERPARHRGPIANPLAWPSAWPAPSCAAHAVRAQARSNSRHHHSWDPRVKSFYPKPPPPLFMWSTRPRSQKRGNHPALSPHSLPLPPCLTPRSTRRNAHSSPPFVVSVEVSLSPSSLPSPPPRHAPLP